MTPPAAYAQCIIAPSNQTACINVNGKNVCPSPADKYNIVHGLGMRHYWSSDLICNTHVVIDPTTGAVVDNHVDGYNPNYDLCGHARYDFIPDLLNGRYWTFSSLVGRVVSDKT